MGEILEEGDKDDGEKKEGGEGEEGAEKPGAAEKEGATEDPAVVKEVQCVCGNWKSGQLRLSNSMNEIGQM